MWHKLLGVIFSLVILAGIADIAPGVSDDMYFLGLCILCAGFMSGSGRD